jgi:predicted DNA-binding ribbon-helix-helix protein
MDSTGIDVGTSVKHRGLANDPDAMRKRSVVIAGHRTSVSLETVFWAALKEIADIRGLSVNRLVETIDASRATNLSSAIRVFVLKAVQDTNQGYRLPS